LSRNVKANDVGFMEANKDVNKNIKSMGLDNEDIAEAKSFLSSFIPREVLFDEFDSDHGKNLLYAIYAREILQAWSRKSPSEKLRYLNGGERSPSDFVQEVMMGFKDGETNCLGVFPAVQPSTKEKMNPHAYDPGGKGDPTVCPHCDVSFWTKAAGNGDPRWENIKGHPVAEWRKDEEEAPNYIKIPVKPDAVGGGPVWNFCGGKHEIFLIGDESGVNVDLPLEITGRSLEQLESDGRYRKVQTENGIKHFVVDEYATDVENKLRNNGEKDLPYKEFNKDWIFEEDGKWYRQCRHPVKLKSPSSYIRTSFSFFAAKANTSTGEEITVKMYHCPYKDLSVVGGESGQMYDLADKGERKTRKSRGGKSKEYWSYPDRCPGVFRDVNSIVKPKKSQEGFEKAEPIDNVHCNVCHRIFDATELPEDHVTTYKHNNNTLTSINAPSGVNESGETSTLSDMLPAQMGREESQLEFDEVMQEINEEIDRIASTLKIKGADKAKEIFYDWKVNDLKLKEITNKYFNDDYQLHFTECLDCGYTREEKANPDANTIKRYYAGGSPFTMRSCPNAKNHEVELPEIQETEVEVDPFAAMEVVTEGPAGVKKEEKGKSIDLSTLDEETRKKIEGKNLAYHGVEGSFVDGMLLPPDDPRSYDGSMGEVTYHIYAPAERLLSALCKKLIESNLVSENLGDDLEYIANLRRQLTVRSFCRGLKIK